MNPVNLSSAQKWENATLANKFLFYKIFTHNPDMCKHLLEILLHVEIEKITPPQGEETFDVDFEAHGIRLDVYVKNESGAYDLEMQTVDTKELPKRARYYQGLMDVDNLKVREDFRSLPDTYVIFITESDVWGEGQPIYLIERINTTTGRNFDDGEHIIYVNGAYDNKDDTSDLAKLIHDFKCKKADDMLLYPFAERVRFLKETPKGVERMCKIMEERVKENERRLLIKIAADFLKLGTVSHEDIAKATGLSLETINELAEELKGVPA